MTRESDDVPEGEPAAGGREERSGCGWPLVRLLVLAALAVTLAFPWTTDIQPLAGAVAIGLIGAFTLGLFCVPYLLVFAVGTTLPLLDAFAPPERFRQGRNILSLVFLTALAVAAVLAVGMAFANGLDRLDDSWGGLIYAALAVAAFALEIVARGQRRR